MPVVPIVEKPYYNTDDTVNSIANTDAHDAYYEMSAVGKLVARRRPGMKLFTDLSSKYGGDGLFWWDKKNLVVAVNGGKVYIIDANGFKREITGVTMNRGTPVTFADGQKLDGSPLLYMANGGKMAYMADEFTIANPTDVNAPAHVSHVAYLNLRFLANEVDTPRFYFTDVNPATSQMDPFYWSSTDSPLTTDSKGDNLTALHVAWNEIHAWGTQSLEPWQDDGTTPFSPMQSATTEAGLLAPYSVIQCDNSILALVLIDKKRCVIKLVGRTPQIVSEDISRVLAEYDVVDDAIASVVSAGGLSIYLLSFPTQGVTWAYDLKTQVWVKWSKWNLETAEYERFIGQHFCFAKAWGKYLIMSRVDGKIYELDRDIFTDNGEVMRFMIQTAYIDQGTYRRKRAKEFRIKAKCGATKTKEPTLLMYFRDDGDAEWGVPVEISLGDKGQRGFIEPMNRMGVYRSRQYQFVCTDDCDIALVHAEEEVTELRN